MKFFKEFGTLKDNYLFVFFFFLVVCLDICLFWFVCDLVHYYSGVSGFIIIIIIIGRIGASCPSFQIDKSLNAKKKKSSHSCG